MAASPGEVRQPQLLLDLLRWLAQLLGAHPPAQAFDPAQTAGRPPVRCRTVFCLRLRYD